MTGIHATNAACKAAGDGSKSNWENNVGHTATWKAKYEKAKAHCDANAGSTANPPWVHPFPCNPYGHEFYDGANDVKKYGDLTDGKFKYERLMEALAEAATNDDNNAGPLLMCQWFAGDRDWGGLLESSAAKSAAHDKGPAALHPKHRRPCGCFFSPWEDKGTFYYHRCVGTCSKTKATICSDDDDCTKTCSITKEQPCSDAGDCVKLCSLTKTYRTGYDIPPPPMCESDDDCPGGQTCDSQDCAAVAGNVCEFHEEDEEHDCGTNGRKCVCFPEVQ